MSDLERRLVGLRARVGTQWSEADRTLVAGRIERAIVRRRRARQVGAGAVVLAFATVWGLSSSPNAERAAPLPEVAVRPPEARTAPMAAPAVAQAEPAPTPEDGILLPDGSRVVAANGARWELAQSTPTRVLVRLLRGRVTLHVVHRTDRRFVVEAGPIKVVDLGTVFDVDRGGGKVHVAVREGSVRVEAGGAARARAIAAGQEVTYDEGQSATRAPMPVPAAAPPAGSWRSLAHAGRYHDAFERMASDTDPVDEEASSLLLAADVSRWSGHPEQASRYLQRFLEMHGKDRRASLAAFTLGRVLLLELGRPHDAASAFERARVAEPNGPLAEDALARETESWSRAGEAERARRSAELFIDSYPKSRRTDEVRGLGGMR